MPKLIDYPRTTYAGAWELSEVIDDTGGKCTIDTAARKLNRKVSGSFKAIIGSAVKFGLLTSKRELLSTTTLFRRIKHAYDKQEELQFHREAFLTPPLFSQLCRKFRSRELPVQMLDVMLMREFSVEEINAQAVARAFVEGARMVGLLDETNTIADIDHMAATAAPRRELASPALPMNTFRPESHAAPTDNESNGTTTNGQTLQQPNPNAASMARANNSAFQNNDSTSATESRPRPAQEPLAGPDAVASLFGLPGSSAVPLPTPTPRPVPAPPHAAPSAPQRVPAPSVAPAANASTTEVAARHNGAGYHIQISGPGLDTQLSINDEADLLLVSALLEKIRRQLNG